METPTDDDASPARLRGTPSWLITHTATHANRLVTAGFAAADARRYHYSLLAALEEFGPASQAALGRRSGMDRSDVVAMINELADKHLVERTPDPADRRRNIITITPAGVQQLRRLDGVVAAIQDQLLGPLSANERKELVRLLSRMLDYHTRG
jgi:DNA-binding MarR family transcriptional regulator